MTQKKGQITAQQTKAIEVLLTSRSIQQASETCGLAYKTLRRWLGDPTFKAALIQREGETLDAATRRLAGLGNDAIDTMAKIMTSGENRDLSSACELSYWVRARNRDDSLACCCRTS